MTELVNVKGLRELNDFLQQVSAKVERNVLRGALRAGAKVIQPVAKANAPKHTGTLAAGIAVSTSAKGGVVIGRVVLTGPHAYLGHWLEYGVAAHQITASPGHWLPIGGGFYKSVHHPGIQPHPFLRPALDSQAGAAVVAVGNYIKERLATKEGLDTADVDVGLQ